MEKYKVGIIGATGMVGQRLLTLLKNHPWFEVSLLAASKRSAGKTYEQALDGRWKMQEALDEKYKNMLVCDAGETNYISDNVDFVFCAVDMEKTATKDLEETLAKAEIPVVSCNSACRMIDDVPMLIPEINFHHADIIHYQRKRLKTKHGFIAVKPNCSIQSYVPALYPLLNFNPYAVSVCTYQAISGAGKRFQDWPEMNDNLIPYIGGEEEKSEKEPLKVFGRIQDGQIFDYKKMMISAQCLRVPISDGHMAAVSVKMEHMPSKEVIIDIWKNFIPKTRAFNLPSAPEKFLTYFDEDNRPQTRLDRDLYNGMGISIGRFREDEIFDFKFVSLSHNTIRGAAGGAVLMAEYLCYANYIQRR